MNLTTNNVLVDSSFLFCLFNANTKQHADVKKASQQIRGQLIILNITLTEVAFLFRRIGGVPATASFLTSFVAGQPNLMSVNSVDLIRARNIMNAYPQSELDFVDCCIVAVAERLNIAQIATLDNRDFGIIRPKHCDYFEIIP